MAAAYSNVLAANWTPIEGNPLVQYDSSSLKTWKSEDDHLFIDSWVKAFDITETSVKYSISNIVFKCGERREFMLMQAVIYKGTGELISNRTISSENLHWRSAVPETNSDVLSATLCRIAYNKHMRPQK